MEDLEKALQKERDNLRDLTYIKRSQRIAQVKKIRSILKEMKIMKKG
jgi:hypothetical protein